MDNRVATPNTQTARPKPASPRDSPIPKTATPKTALPTLPKILHSRSHSLGNGHGGNEDIPPFPGYSRYCLRRMDQAQSSPPDHMPREREWE